jgi:hypothetical protein
VDCFGAFCLSNPLTRNSHMGLDQAIFCDIGRCNFVAPCTDDFDTPVSCDNHPKDFRGHPSEGSPVSSSVSSERTSRVCPLFLLKYEPVF